MAHPSWKLDEHKAHDETESHALLVEKLGVIVGFLVGLGVGLGLVAEPMTAAEWPHWVALPITLATVAACTWLGHRAGTLAGERLYSDR